MDYSSWDRKESDTTKQLNTQHFPLCTECQRHSPPLSILLLCFVTAIHVSSHCQLSLGKREEEEKKRKAYKDLPDTFKTKDAVDIGHRHGLSQSTVKRWLKTSLFTNLSYGKYAKAEMT